MSNLADELLAAHVEHEISRLRGESLNELLDQGVAAMFEWLEDVKFNDVVTREQIVGVIERYVIELRVSGGIAELAGEMANVVFESKESARTRLRDVFAPDDYEAFADKIVALQGAQRELIRYVTRSSTFGTLASRAVSHVLIDLLFGRDSRSLRSAVVAMLEHRFGPGLERRVEAALGRYIERHGKRLTKESEKHLLEVFDPDWVRQMADEIYDTVSTRRLSDAGTVFSAQDLEDFVVLVYEFWLKFRRTPYFHAVIVEVVDRLFMKYGDESVFSVIEDMGITEEMVKHEVKTFVPPVVDHAFETGFLEKWVRSHLEPFYRSGAVSEILGR